MAVVRLKREQAQLLVVDIQERLCAAMPEEPLAEMLARTQALIQGARALALPIHLTEQYPRGLGTTVGMLRDEIGIVTPIEKIEFTALVPRVQAALAGRSQVLVAGMEAHICVFQTVRDLAEQGFLPIVCADAILSRNETDLRVGLELCRQAGAQVMTVESALFDLLGRAGTPEFKAISQAVK